MIDGQMIYDSTVVSDFMRCPRRCYWRHVRNLVPKQGVAAPSFGAAIHAGLNAWYETHIIDNAITVFHANWQDRIDDDLHTHERGEAILRAYADRYPTEPWHVKSLERTFNLQLPNGLWYCGRMDGIIEWAGTVLVLDHKTTSRLGGWFFKQFRPHLQFTGYVWAAQQLTERAVNGILVNAIGVYKTKFEFDRDISSREPFEVEQWLNMICRCTNQINHAVTISTDQRTREVDVAAAKLLFPMNWLGCSDYGGCSYRDLCICDDTGAERLIDLMFDIQPWTPLEKED